MHVGVIDICFHTSKHQKVMYIQIHTYNLPWKRLEVLRLYSCLSSSSCTLSAHSGLRDMPMRHVPLDSRFGISRLSSMVPNVRAEGMRVLSLLVAYQRLHAQFRSLALIFMASSLRSMMHHSSRNSERSSNLSLASAVHLLTFEGAFRPSR